MINKTNINQLFFVYSSCG